MLVVCGRWTLPGPQRTGAGILDSYRRRTSDEYERALAPAAEAPSAAPAAPGLAPHPGERPRPRACALRRLGSRADGLCPLAHGDGAHGDLRPGYRGRLG